MKKHRSRPAPRRKPVRASGPPPPRQPNWDQPITFEPDILYDPMLDPAPEIWFDLDEQERIDVVELYHEGLDLDLPSLATHAALHVAVENQIAMRDETPVRATLQRLMSEGLDRHEAVHAIATVLADLIYDAGKGAAISDPNHTYYEGLSRLTAQSWRHMLDDDESSSEA